MPRVGTLSMATVRSFAKCFLSVPGLGFRVRVWGLGFGVEGLGFKRLGAEAL